jgi:hypothetical protein
MFQLMYGTFVFDISRIQRGGRFKQDEPAFFFRNWTVLDSAWNYDELALFDPFVPLAKVHAEAAFDHQKHFVLVVMMVKYELAVQLDEFDLLAVKLCSNAGLVVFGDLRKLLSDIDFGHKSSISITVFLMDGASCMHVAGNSLLADTLG